MLAVVAVVASGAAMLNGVGFAPPFDVGVAEGSAVLFDANLLHAVWPNVSDGPSERLAFHFIPGDLNSAFRGVSFARGAFADRHVAVGPSEEG